MGWRLGHGADDPVPVKRTRCYESSDYVSQAEEHSSGVQGLNQAVVPYKKKKFNIRHITESGRIH